MRLWILPWCLIALLFAAAVGCSSGSSPIAPPDGMEEMTPASNVPASELGCDSCRYLWGY